MAQSLNYKTPAPSARVLTEEAAFSGGMMWTGNNVDALHLKSIVNFDYDETTGYLKTRPGLSADEQFFQSPQLLNKTLLGVYNLTLINYNAVVTSSNKWGIESSYGSTMQCLLFGVLTDSLSFDLTYERGVYANLSDVIALLQTPTGWQLIPVSKGHLPITNTYDATSETAAYTTYIDDALLSSTTGTDPIDTAFYLAHLTGAYKIEPVQYDNCVYATCVSYNGTIPLLRFKLGTYETTLGVRKYFGMWESMADDCNAIRLLEATATGYNALRDDKMFSYESTTSTDNIIEGVFLKDSNNQIVVAPRLGQTVTIVPVTACAVGKSIKIEIANVDSVSDDTVFETLTTLTTATGTQPTFGYKVNTERFTLRVTLSSDNTTYDSVLCSYNTNKGVNNISIRTYPLSQANRSCLWNKHLVLFNIPTANNTIFISETDNFGYFPYPYNQEVFESAVINCISYMGNLLVFTTDKIYSLAEGESGTFTSTVIQNNIPMTAEDSVYSLCIKNMVFFKTGSYFYMVVPKSKSLTGELTIAPIYKNMSRWFDNTTAAVLDIMQATYPDYNVTAINHCDLQDVYAEQDTVRILYNITAQYKPVTDGVLAQGNKELNALFFLNYNTNLRAWTMYVVETMIGNIYKGSLVASRVMELISVDNAGVLRKHLFNTLTTNDSLIEGAQLRCYIDTGYRTLTTSLKKRFREIQVKLYSKNDDVTEFGSMFYVDGQTRMTCTKLEHVTLGDADSGSAAYTYTLAPVYDVNVLFNTESSPALDSGDVHKDSDKAVLTSWKLNFSHFVKDAPSTVRIPVSGKGFNPRFTLLCKQSTPFEINGINWVYRPMYGR